MSRGQLGEMTEVINSDHLTQGFLIFCSKCGHALSIHTENRPINEDSIDSICRYDNGHYVCQCDGFESEKITKILDTGQRNPSIAIVESPNNTENNAIVNKKETEEHD